MTKKVKSCPFCNREKLKDQIFWENSQCFAFLVNRPKIAKHFVIAPKKHLENFDPKLSALLTSQAFRLSKNLDIVSFTVKFNVGVWRIQKSPNHIRHIHLHIIPASSKICEALPKLKNMRLIKADREELTKTLSRHRKLKEKGVKLKMYKKTTWGRK